MKENIENNIKNQNVVITGVTSFLGSNLAKYLVQCGYNIYGIMRPNSANAKNIDEIKCKIHIIELDMNDMKNINKYKEKIVKDSIFIHMAWDSNSINGRYDEELQKSNFENSINIIKLYNEISAKKFIFTSSQAEDNDTPYGVYKKKFSEYGKKYIENFVHLRVFSIYGENDYRNTLIKYIIECIKNKKVAKVGKCEHIWNYLYIDDFVKIMKYFIDKDVNCNKSYDIASDRNIALKEYLKYFEEKYKLEIQYSAVEKEDEKFAVPNITTLLEVIGKDYKFIDFMEKYVIF